MRIILDINPTLRRSRGDFGNRGVVDMVIIMKIKYYNLL